jgi:hypothetical protein
MSRGLTRMTLATIAAVFTAVVAQDVTALSKKNPWGITVVKFKSGTTAAQMNAAVAAAGASVVTDIAAVNAVSVLPNRSSFSNEISKDARVVAVWEEEITVTIPHPDVLAQDGATSGRSTRRVG